MQKYLTFKNIDYKLKWLYLEYTRLHERYIIKVTFTHIFFFLLLFNIATRKLKILCVAHITFLLESTDQEKYSDLSTITTTKKASWEANFHILFYSSHFVIIYSFDTFHLNNEKI